MNEIEKDNIIDLINSGSAIIGSATGGVIGFLTGGPVGAATGGASGVIMAKALSKIGTEIKQRFLGKREEIRIGATITYSTEKIQKNLKAGKELRDDDFFENKIHSRSDAEEISEGILLLAQKEYNEQKLKYIGNLLGNIPFDNHIDKSFANQLIRASERLSYSQLCLLKIFRNSGNQKKLKLKDSNYRDNTSFDRKLVTVLYDIIELENMQLIVNSEKLIFGLTDIIPSQFSVQGNGNALINLMELESLPDEDCETIIEILS